MDTNKPWSYAHRARQSSEFAPEIERTDTVLINGGAAVAHAQPGDPDLCIGRPIAFHPEITPPPPHHRLYPGQPHSAGPIALQSPYLCTVKTHRHHKNSGHDVDSACHWRLVVQKGRGKVPQNRPKVHSRAVVVFFFTLGSNGVRFEACLYDETTPAHIRSLQGHCSRPVAKPEFFEHMFEIPHGCTNVIYQSSSRQHGLIAGGIGRIDGRQACYLSDAHPQQSNEVFDQKNWKPQIVPNDHHKWQSDTTYEIDLVKAQEMELKLYHTFSYAVVHVRDMPADMYRKSRWTRRSDLVRKTITRRTVTLTLA